MKLRSLAARLVAVAMAAFALLVVVGPALADAPVALPTAPGASRAAIDPTAARASLPGDNGSPVEPYLFLFILAGGGIIGVGFAFLADRRIRASAGNVELQRKVF